MTPTCVAFWTAMIGAAPTMDGSWVVAGSGSSRFADHINPRLAGIREPQSVAYRAHDNVVLFTGTAENCIRRFGDRQHALGLVGAGEHAVGDAVGDRPRLARAGPGDDEEAAAVVGDGDPPVADRAEVHQGMLEGSNVNSVQEMTQMIMCLRQYEANQKAAQHQDDTLAKAVSEVARM